MAEEMRLDDRLGLKLIDTLKPFAEVAERFQQCHVVEICEPHPDNPSPNILPLPREWFERAADDLEAIVIQLHHNGVLSEGQASKLTGLDRVSVRKLADASAPSQPEGQQSVDVGERERIARIIEPRVLFGPARNRVHAERMKEAYAKADAILTGAEHG